MNIFFRRFSIATGLSILILFVLSFTQLNVLPLLFTLLVVEPQVGWLFFAILGVPFGGFLALLLFTPNSKFLVYLADLCGFWVGGLFGSLIGLYIADPQFEEIEGVALQREEAAELNPEGSQ